MTELWLVRHGQTDWNVQRRYQGQSDLPLNDLGRAQAIALAGELSGKHFAALYSSDLSRARETAEMIAAHLNLDVHLDRRLRQISQGDWEGLLVSEVIANYREAWSQQTADPLNAHAPGGETIGELSARMTAAANDIVHAHPVGPVLIVSHGLSLAALLCRVRDMPLSQVYQLKSDNAQPDIIEWVLG